MVRLILVSLAALLLSACSMSIAPYNRGPGSEEIESFADSRMTEAERDAINTVYTAMFERDADAIVPLLIDSLQTGDVAQTLEQLFDYLPGEPPVESNQITYHKNQHTTVGSQTTLTVLSEWALEYDDGSVYSLSITALSVNDSPLRVQHLNVNQVDPAIYAMPAEIGTTRILMAMAAIATPVVTILALVALFRIEGTGRKIIWFFIITATFPVVMFNWSTEAFQLAAPGINANGSNFNLSIYRWIIGGVQISKLGDYHPWILTIGFPFGAILFWIRFIFRRSSETTPGPDGTPE